MRGRQVTATLVSGVFLFLLAFLSSSRCWFPVGVPRLHRSGRCQVKSPFSLGQNAFVRDSILSVELASLISVREAAERLGVSPAAVRQQIAYQRLPAVKRGPGWWLDTRAVERLARQPLGRGRPLSPEMAWAVLLLASGDAEAAARAAGRDRYRSRADAWLRDHELVEHAARLRARALPEEFDAHPSELSRILKRPEVLCTGISAGGILGLIGGPEAAEGYAPATCRNYIVDEHALHAGAGPVRLRWIRDDLWTLLTSRDRRVAPRAAVIVDLLEHDDPRARREAARALTR